jgi:hypothetical protein
MIAVELLLISVSALLGAAMTAGNWTMVISWYARRQHGSLIPALGGLLLADAMLLVPSLRVGHYAWLPLIVDPGGLYLMTAGVVLFLQKRRR